MSHRMIRFGVIKAPSNDKGPHKLTTVVADGKEMQVQVIEPYGVQGSPIKDGMVLILTPDGDDGKAVGIMMPPPKDRVDQQKPGEVTYKNHVTGNRIQHDADGHTMIETKADERSTIGGSMTADVGSDRTDKAGGTHRINTGGVLLLNC